MNEFHSIFYLSCLLNFKFVSEPSMDYIVEEMKEDFFLETSKLFNLKNVHKIIFIYQKS